MAFLSTKKRKSVCFLADFLIVGGLEKVLCSAIKALSPDYDITIITINGTVAKPIITELRDHTSFINVNCTPHGILHYMMIVPILGGLVFNRLIPQKFDYLVILRPWYMMASYSRIASKTIFWSHGEKDVIYASKSGLSLKKKLNRIRLQIGYKHLDSVWVPNIYLKNKLIEAFHLTNVHVLLNNIDCASITSQSYAPIPDLFHPNFFHFVSVARLSEEKAHIRMLHAIEKLKDQYPCKLVLVGDGPQRAFLETYVAEHGLTRHVIFAGNQPNPYPYIRNANALVLSSVNESFGLVLLEAMILSVPVISTATIGGIYLTDHGKLGMLVENSEEGIYYGMRLALENPSALQAHTGNAYIWASSFDISVFNETINNLVAST